MTSRSALARAYPATIGRSCSRARWQSRILRTALGSFPGSVAACSSSQSPTPVTSSGARKCSASSPASISTAAVTAGGDQVTASIGPPYPDTTRAAICQATAGVISLRVGSSASRSAWSATSRAA